MMAGEGAIAAEQAWQAAHVDEDWQIEQWGEDAEAKAAAPPAAANLTQRSNF